MITLIHQSISAFMLCVFTIDSSMILLLPGVSTLTVFSAFYLVLSVVSDDLACTGLKNRPWYFFFSSTKCVFFSCSRDSRTLTPIIDTLMSFLQRIYLAMLLFDETYVSHDLYFVESNQLSWKVALEWILLVIFTRFNRVQISPSQFAICEAFWQFANEFLHFF